MLRLHVTNGDHAAEGLSRSGLPGDVLAWRDVLHDGPVPSDLDAAAFGATRAAFLADGVWRTEDDIREDFAARDARMQGLGVDDGVVLWFEPDLYDQLQLIQVLAFFARRPAAARPRIEIAPADVMLGNLSPDKFVPLYDARRAIGERELQAGRRAWEAFTDVTPDALQDVLRQLDRDLSQRHFSADEDARLPHLTAALRRMSEEYPDVDTGMSRSERQICEALAPGAITMAKLYQSSHHAAESWIWLGDTSFAWYVQRLSDGARPVISHVNGTRVVAAESRGHERLFWERQVVLTPFGADVVRARANMIDANGIDRWIGGVRLTTGLHWRWDSARQRTVRWSGRSATTS